MCLVCTTLATGGIVLLLRWGRALARLLQRVLAVAVAEWREML